MKSDVRLRRGGMNLLLSSLLGAACMILAGCAKQGLALSITNYRNDGTVERFHEPFREAYFDTDEQGNVEVVLRTASPLESNPNEEIVQLVHLKTFWRSQPGKTVAHRTQLNATVTFCVMSPALIANYEGTGSLFVTRRKNHDELSGELELARLTPARTISGDSPIFERSELQGVFRARRDARRVTTLVNEMDRVFGRK